MRTISVGLIGCLLLFSLSVALAEDADPSHPSDLSKEVATDPAGLLVPPGFRVERLYSVPLATEGSWVSMTADPRGRLIVCDQKGSLYRVTPSPLGISTIESVEKIDIKLESAQGLLYAFDSLYVIVNQSGKYPAGLYRVRDTDGDDHFDLVELLHKLGGQGGEHGPHGIVLAPDGKSLYVVAGNITELPAGVGSYHLPKTWQEDQLLLRNPASSGHNSGVLAPGGWVCEVSPDGKQWNLLAAGFRNAYDIAFNRAGDLFTFDADMEHDVGAPWYRPTRVCHVVSGGEFGWRFGTGKWPSYSPDSVPPVLDVGLGSPTGTAFGYGANFPSKYRDALYICDWTHGRLFEVHLQPRGGSYSAQFEEFISGTPLPLTDIVVNPKDGAMYFTIGGRKTQSGLYRVTWTGGAVRSTTVDPIQMPDQHQLRKQLEALHAEPRADQLEFIWNELGNEDRFVRYAARIALEHLNAEAWQSRVLDESDPETKINGLLALARTANAPASEILAAATKLWDQSLGERQRTDLLRVLAVSFARHGKPRVEKAAPLAEKLAASFPAGTTPLDYELCRTLVYLDEPGVVPAALSLMQQAKTQEGLLNYAMSLRVATRGWTKESRETYLELLNEAERKSITGEYVGGGHLQRYIQQMRANVEERMSPEQQRSFADLLHPTMPRAASVGSPTPRKYVKTWTVEELLPSLPEVSNNRDFKRGKALFSAAACIACHRFNGLGGIFGPDLTAVAKRYSRPVLLREIIDPSVQVSDQYQTDTILTDAGKVYAGRILHRGDTHWTVAVDPRQPSAVLQIPTEEIEEVAPSKTSMMPKNLLDTLTRKEIFDLLAYLESAGDPESAAFAEAKEGEE